MKKVIRIFGIVILSILLFVLLLTVTAKVFEDNIAKAVLSRVSEEIDAPVEIESVDFNLVRKFPLSTIEFNNLWLKCPETKQDTIAGIKKLYVSVNSRRIIEGFYDVEKVEIDGLKLHYDIDNDSVCNIDFLLALMPESEPDTSTSPMHINMRLESLLLENLECSYYDASSNVGATVLVPEIFLKGNILGDDYTAKTRGNITITDINYANFKLDKIEKAALNFNLDYEGDSVKIEKFAFKTNGVEMNADGYAVLGDDIMINTSIAESELDLNVLSTYLPKAMLQEFGVESAHGVLAFNSTINGIYNDSTMPQVDFDFHFDDGAVKTVEYPEVKLLSFSGNASNGYLQNNSSIYLNLNSFNVETSESQLELKAKVSNIDKPIYELYSKGKINISEFKSFIPEDVVRSVSGLLSYEFGTKGQMPDEFDDAFTDYAMNNSWLKLNLQGIDANLDDTLKVNDLFANFSYKPGSVVLNGLYVVVPTYDIQVKNTKADINYDGVISNMDAMSFDINDFHFEFDNSYLDMQASLSNLTDPDYKFNGEIKIDLADVRQFVPDTLVASMSGVFAAKINSEGYIHLDSIETQAMALAFEKSSMNLHCEDINVEMTDTLLEVTNLNTDFSMKPDSIFLDNFSGTYKGLDFAIKNTELINAYQTVLLNQPDTLKAITYIEIGDVDYALLEPFMVEEETEINTTEAENNDTVAAPVNYKMDIKGSVAVNSFNLENYVVDTSMTVKKLYVENLSTLFSVTDSVYIADSLIFNAFGGYVKTSARYEIKPDNTLVTVKNHIDGLDFEQILYNMDNFGQQDITHNNISGELLSDMNVEATMYGDSIPFDKARMSGDFTLTNGAILDFEPAKELSKFTGIKELDNIQFQTLKTHLFVFNNAAYIPKTEIVNSAVDVTFFGMQSIDSLEDEFEYHIELNLGDVLTGKRDNLMKKQADADKDAGEQVKRNGVNLFYQQYDNKISKGFDRKDKMDLMLKKVRLQERFLNLTFNPLRINYNTNVDVEKKED